MHFWKMEASLRIMSVILLALTACLVGLDSQTKIIFFTLTKKATFRDLDALYGIVWIDTAAAIYNLLQLVRGCILPGFRKDLTASHRFVCWAIYLLDQTATYVVFGGNTAAVQASMLAVTGEKSLQWMKVCDKFAKFCAQIGGALLCGYVATVLMVVTSSISAYALFRLYSPKSFLLLKAE